MSQTQTRPTVELAVVTLNVEGLLRDAAGLPVADALGEAVFDASTD
jgi:hypothetical protein